MAVPIAPLLLAALISGGIKAGTAIAKGIKGRKDRKKGEAQMEKSLEDIKYTKPEEYGQIMNILKQREGTVTSRREAAEENIRDTTASAMTGIRQAADSPVAALTAYTGLKDREMKAIAGVGEVFEEKRDMAQMGVAQGLEAGAGYSEKEQYYNQMYKNMVRANLGASRMMAGQNMAAQGLGQLGAAGLDFAGTKYLSSLYNPQQAATPGFDPANEGAVDPDAGVEDWMTKPFNQ